MVAEEAKVENTGPSASSTMEDVPPDPDTEVDDAPKLSRELEDPVEGERLAKRRKHESDSSGKRRKDKHQEEKKSKRPKEAEQENVEDFFEDEVLLWKTLKIINLFRRKAG